MRPVLVSAVAALLLAGAFLLLRALPDGAPALSRSMLVVGGRALVALAYVAFLAAAFFAFFSLRRPGARLAYGLAAFAVAAVAAFPLTFVWLFYPDEICVSLRTTVADSERVLDRQTTANAEWRLVFEYVGFQDVDPFVNLYRDPKQPPRVRRCRDGEPVLSIPTDKKVASAKFSPETRAVTVRYEDGSTSTARVEAPVD